MRKSKGVTLIELIITVAILAIVIAPISSLIGNTIKIASKSNEKQKAVNLAQKYMEKIKNGEIQILDNKITVLQAEEQLKKEDPNYEIEYSLEEENIDVFENDGEENIEEESIFDKDKINYDYNVVLEKVSGIDRIKFYESISSIYSFNAHVENPTLEFINNKYEIMYKLKDNELELESGVITKKNEALGKDVNVKVEINIPLKFKIECENKCQDTVLNFYLIKKEDVKDSAHIDFINKGGEIVKYSNIISNNNLKDSNLKRIYKVIVEVKKNGQILQRLEGYKLIN